MKSALVLGVLLTLISTGPLARAQPTPTPTPGGLTCELLKDGVAIGGSMPCSDCDTFSHSSWTQDGQLVVFTCQTTAQPLSNCGSSSLPACSGWERLFGGGCR